MPDPRKMNVGDLVRFVALPDEWNDPRRSVLPESVEFMKVMISRRWPSRICKKDEFGYPWIAARIRNGDRIEHHHWGIYEATGWRVVRSRGAKR